MERGDEALNCGNTSITVIANTPVIARLDRATQYAVMPVVLRRPLEYWITRFRG
jgi:hypothetical protein